MMPLYSLLVTPVVGTIWILSSIPLAIGGTILAKKYSKWFCLLSIAASIMIFLLLEALVSTSPINPDHLMQDVRSALPWIVLSGASIASIAPAID